jgi:hypothetical protein
MTAQQQISEEILAKITACSRTRWMTYYGRRDWETGLAKYWGEAHGYVGAQGGWVYTSTGKPVIQGWYGFFQMRKGAMLDWLTEKLTGFKTFRAMLDAEGVYRPTLHTGGKGGWEYEVLSEAYDDAQRARGNSKRAHRGRGYFKLGRLRGEYDRTWIRSEHLVNGEYEAEHRAICGQAVSDIAGDLNAKSFQYVTCEECKAKAGFAS